MVPLFTVLLPVRRLPVFLPLAIESVLEQSLTDFELVVICDGAPGETVACAEEYARRDARVKVNGHSKSERQAEAYRHIALAASGARYVAHVCDDDLWFPNHLVEMEKLLSATDFGNLPLVRVRRDGSIDLTAGDLARPETRRLLLDEEYSFFGLTQAGYRLDAYRRLPVGWAPAPTGVGTELHMWRKFLSIDSLTFATRATPSSLTLGSPERFDATQEQRGAEHRAWLERIRDPQQRDAIVQEAARSLFDKIAWKDAQVAATAAACMKLDAELRQMTISSEQYRAALLEMSNWRDDYRDEFSRMTASRDEYVGYLDLMVADRDNYQAQLNAMTASRDEYAGHLNLMAANLDNYQAQLEAMTASLDKYREEFRRMQTAAASWQREKNTLTHALAALQADLDQLTRSKSWRVTAPMRALMTMWKRRR